MAKTGARGAAQRPGKPDFSAFIAEIEAIVSGKSAKGSVARILKLLKIGYSDKLLPHHLDQLLNLIQPWPECSRLAIALYVETMTKRPSELMKAIRNRLLTFAHSTVGYPFPPDGPSDSQVSDREEKLLTWLDDQFKDANPKEGLDSLARPLSVIDRARWLLLTLVQEADASVRYGAIYKLFDHLIGGPKTGDPHLQEAGFVAEFGGLLSAEKPNLQRVRAALRASSAARTTEERYRTELCRTLATLGASRERSAELSRLNSELEGEVQELRRRLLDLEATCRRKEDDLKELHQERLLDQEHWQAQCELRLSKLTGSVRSRLGHEVSEVKISLSQDPPSVRMALDRLARIEKALERLKEE